MSGGGIAAGVEEARPFGDAGTTWFVAGLAIENGDGEVFVSGSAAFTRGRDSAVAARKLSALFASIADAAMAEGPAEPEPAAVPPVRVANPFRRKA